MKEKFKLKKYDTVQELIVEMYDNQIPIDELKDSKFGGVDEKGNTISLTYEDEMRVYEEMGFYGFIGEDNTIHFWISKKNPPSFEDLLFFFGHEIGHNMGVSCSDEDYIKEEERADEYAETAKLAYKFAKSVNNINKIKIENNG